MREDIEGKTAFHWTVDNPNTSCIQTLLTAQPDILNQQDGEGKTLLHLACEYKLSHIVFYLLHQDGLLIDARDSMGRSSLHYAAISGAPMLIEALLSRKALDSIFDLEGLTALHYAVQHQRVDCVRVFMLLESPSHLPDLEFRTPLMYASVLSNVQILSSLLSHPEVATQINAVDKQENSCLLYALLATQSPETMRILLQSGADPNTVNTTGYNALHICCQTNNIEVAVLLIESGASITLPDLQDNLPPIHIAVRHTSIDVLGLLAVHPLSVNLVTQDGLNALHFAAQLGDTQQVQILLNSPLKPSLLNALDAVGLAPIHHAVLKGNTAVVELLCEFGAYLLLQLIEYDFDTCVDLAVNNNSADVIAVLRKYGAMTNFELRTNAAVVIQSYIRCYFARILFANLKISSRAVTIISANFRSFQARLQYKALKRDHLKATIIQAFFRGYRQRKQFVGDLAKFRAVRTHNEYIDSINTIYLKEIRDGKIKTFTIEDLDFKDCLFISPWRSSLREKRLENIDEQTRRLENEQHLRLENALQLRKKLEKDKCSWFEFLEFEKKRREDKFRFQNRQRNLKIIQESKMRRSEITEKYNSTRTLQHKINSAIVIQRKFRAWIHFASVKKLKNSVETARLRSHEKAANIIQKHWRSHQYQMLQREFKETFEILETNIDYPIAVFGTPHHHQPVPPLQTRSKSYQADTLLTLKPRRKLLMPPARDVLIEAKRDLLTKSLPEGKFAELKESTQAGKTSSIVDLNRYASLNVLDLNLSCPTRKLKHVTGRRNSTENVKILFSSIDKTGSPKKSKLVERNSQTLLPMVKPQNTYNDKTRNIPSSSSVTSLPPILQK